MSTPAALPRLHRAALATVAGAVLTVTTVAAVSGAFAGTAADRHPRDHASHAATPAKPGPLRTHRSPTPSAPVTVTGTDWRCEAPADEKFVCSLGEASVVVTWRRASEHEEYLSITKGGGPIFVSDVHGPLFATVMGGPDTTQQQLDEVGAALAWR